MEKRMKEHPLTDRQMQQLLRQAPVGSLATINADGTPYITPVHFAYENGCIYIHGLPEGQKMANIRRDPCVSFNVWHMEGLLLDASGKPCATNTQYQSVTVQGTARIVTQPEDKLRMLQAIVQKYTPQLSAQTMPDQAVETTAVLHIAIQCMTGKFYE